MNLRSDEMNQKILSFIISFSSWLAACFAFTSSYDPKSPSRASPLYRLNASEKDQVNIVAGATGYIGKAVVRESVRQGYKTVALVRDKNKIFSPEGQALYGMFFEGAEVVECDVTNPTELNKVRRVWNIEYIM